MVSERIIRTFCFHAWGKWSDRFQGTWVDPVEHSTEGYMSQKRTCKKCGRISYRKCQ